MGIDLLQMLHFTIFLAQQLFAQSTLKQKIRTVNSLASKPKEMTMEKLTEGKKGTGTHFLCRKHVDSIFSFLNKWFYSPTAWQLLSVLE